jgi:LuxR family maltose regulon positive regulatory protein
MPKAPIPIILLYNVYVCETPLQTKLYIPPNRPNLVPRLRLIEKLNRGLDGKLTLLSAPAGFGKTTLVGEWVGQSELPVAWLSLDKADNDPTRFLTYFIAALQQINPDIGQTAQGMLQSPSVANTTAPPLAEALMTTFINDIGYFCIYAKPPM